MYVYQAAIPQILETTKDDFFSRINYMLREAVDTCYEGVQEIPCITCPKKPEGSMFMIVRPKPTLFLNMSSMSFMINHHIVPTIGSLHVFVFVFMFMCLCSILYAYFQHLC